MADVVPFQIKKKVRDPIPMFNQTSSMFDLTEVSESVLKTLAEAMLQNHCYCPQEVINELEHRAEWHLRQCQQIRDSIESRNVKHRLDRLLRETMRSIDRAENVIHHAIDINDLTKGRIWFEDHEYKSEEAKQSYDEILELVRQWSCDISLGYDADHHEQLSKKIGKSAEEYAAGRVTIQTSTGKHIINYSRTAPK